MARNERKLKGSALVAFGLALLITEGVKFLAIDHETCELPPGEKPDGDGWKILGSETSTHGVHAPVDFVGKPKSVVVWYRQVETEEEASSHSLFTRWTDGGS